MQLAAHHNIAEFAIQFTEPIPKTAKHKCFKLPWMDKFVNVEVVL